MRPKSERFYVTEDERDQINSAAERYHLTKSAYIRYKVFGVTDELCYQNTFARILLELRKGEVDEKIYNKVFRAIKQTEHA